jgi:hypothetical protein
MRRPSKPLTLNQFDESSKASSHTELQHSAKACAAQGAAVSTEDGLIDPDLQAVIEAWLELPEAIKAGILAMVKSAGGSETGEKID